MIPGELTGDLQHDAATFNAHLLMSEVDTDIGRVLSVRETNRHRALIAIAYCQTAQAMLSLDGIERQGQEAGS